MVAINFLPVIQQLFFAACGIFGIGFIIGFHELGHLTFCKLFNIEAPSFSIGFGPRLFTKKIGETEFSISAIPLGGYVEIGGASEEQGPLTERSFMYKPWYQKMLVMIGGIGFNVLFTYIALSLLFMCGMPPSPVLYPSNATSSIAAIAPDSPAAKAGICEGDTIINVNNEPLKEPKILIDSIQANPHTPFSLLVQRANGSQETLVVTTGERMSGGKPVGTLGIVFGIKGLESVSFFTALKNGVSLTHTLIKNTFNTYKHIIFNKDISQVGGPVMVISETMRGASKGAKTLILFLAFISVTLAILNLIPLPILDGGQMLFYSIEALIGRSIPFNVRWYIHVATWIGFMLLTLYLTYKDFARILAPYLGHIIAFFGLVG